MTMACNRQENGNGLEQRMQVNRFKCWAGKLNFKLLRQSSKPNESPFILRRRMRKETDHEEAQNGDASHGPREADLTHQPARHDGSHKFPAGEKIRF